MKKIILLSFIASLLMVSCRPSPTEKTHYLNCKVVIVSNNESYAERQNKYRQPYQAKSWLVKLVSDTNMCREFHSEDSNNWDWHISNEQWYNHKVGDTLFFDYLLKSRFFKIK